MCELASPFVHLSQGQGKDRQDLSLLCPIAGGDWSSGQRFQPLRDYTVSLDDRVYPPVRLEGIERIADICRQRWWFVNLCRKRKPGAPIVNIKMVFSGARQK
ncbi:hypothetical protein V2G26_004826 [Clonostachys chloroleuca]